MSQNSAPDLLNFKRPNRGLRSGLALGTLCIIGTVGAFVFTHQAKSTQANAASLLAEAPTPALDLPVFNVSADMRDQFPSVSTVAYTGTLARRSTLVDTLVGLGAEHTEANLALAAMYTNEMIDPRKLRAGLPVTAHFDADSGGLVSVSVRPDTDRSVFSKRLADGTFRASNLNVKLRPEYRRVSTEITSSIYDAALAAGAKDQQVADFAQIFAFDVDFQREIHPGDKFEIVYESLSDERGNHVRSGDVVFASLNGRTISRDYYRHTPADDEVSDYFTRDGKAATRFLMKTPINGARLSSSFGRRRHPISGYSRLHKGTDFAARSGTPILAAGNGKVERASRYGGYGNYVRIQHANGYETAYAHMRGYGPGIRSGRTVRQGDVVGYVGSTGASTGPHLHYEVIINGRHVNAMALKLPTGRTLEGDLLEAFEVERRQIDALRRSFVSDVAAITAVSQATR